MKKTGLILCVFLVVPTAFAQSSPIGFPRFGTYQNGQFDAVNLQNLNVHMSIPIVSSQGRGLPFSLSIEYDSLVWARSSAWYPRGNWGWNPNSSIGSISYNTQTNYCWVGDLISGFAIQYTVYQDYNYTDPSGTQHWFNTVFTTNQDAITNCSAPAMPRTVYASDGSGYYLDATAPDSPVVSSPSGWQITSSRASLTDTNGNFISATVVSSTETDWADTLGRVILKVMTSATTTQYQLLDPTSTSTTPHYSTAALTFGPFNIRTNFGCAGIVEYSGTANLPTSLSFPGGVSYSFSYEATPGSTTGEVTGRIASVTLPTGGTISYAYTGSNNGIICADGSTAGLNRTTPDGQRTYVRSGSNPAWTTTVTDPQNNQTVLNFQGLYQTQSQAYQGSSASGTLLQTVTTCYNGNTTNCTGTAVSTPITRRTATIQLPGGLQCKHDYFYNGFGLPTEVDEYAYGSGAPGPLIRKSLTSYASLGNNILNRPATVAVQDGAGSTKAQTTYAYDQTAVTATTGTPQHAAVTGARGNPTTISSLVQGATTLSQTFAYYDTGTVQTATDVNGAATTYTYGAASCGNSFVTSIGLPLGLSRSMAWNCTGGVLTSMTDENNQVTSSTFNDPNFWRVTKITDPASNATNFTYTGARSVESSLAFNGGSSVVDVLNTLDSLGRTHVTQQKQGATSANYDSVETDYDALGRPSRVTVPYSGTAGQTNATAPGTTTTYDALGRTTQITDGGGGVVTLSYTQNDALRTVSPAPTGENSKRQQLEYDALGWLTSVCEITQQRDLWSNCGGDGLLDQIHLRRTGRPDRRHAECPDGHASAGAASTGLQLRRAWTLDFRNQSGARNDDIHVRL